MEAAVLVVGPAPPFDDGIAFGCVLLNNVLLEHVDQARLADPCFTNEEHDLTHSLCCLIPAVIQQANLAITADERSQGGGLSDIKPAAVRPFARHPVGFLRACHSLEALATQAGTLKESFDQAIGIVRDY